MRLALALVLAAFLVLATVPPARAQCQGGVCRLPSGPAFGPAYGYGYTYALAYPRGYIVTPPPLLPRVVAPQRPVFALPRFFRHR